MLSMLLMALWPKPNVRHTLLRDDIISDSEVVARHGPSVGNALYNMYVYVLGLNAFLIMIIYLFFIYWTPEQLVTPIKVVYNLSTAGG